MVIVFNSNHKQPIFPSWLERNFKVGEPDHVWARDIAYIWTQEGGLHLVVVIDLYSRKVVGCSLGKRLTVALVCDAQSMAIWERRPYCFSAH
ncbi:DDE-type integrase/transposase/recombinase [Microbulbifer thermotolerans]|uniref:DDE-type integrase/transposase/recombinase n=1 Tax=Microbulbifer thermotolerans TaxID=252514 RepID=UPI00224AC8DB|nr:DDE-type integrase/transposase/recombinase [Microbulbifer thermotolerans]MCX2836358.1 hypothetical protein [Microbulbifer thermotolerans]